jgi:activator of HSP90 ATPase
MTDTIHQEITLEVEPSRVYETLTDSGRFSEVTGGSQTELSPEAGSAFSLFGGAITGRNIEVVPGKRLVQAWRAGPWEDGIYSIVRFELSEDPAGTHLVLDHAGFPGGQHEHLAAGWDTNYWAPLRRHFAQS